MRSVAYPYRVLCYSKTNILSFSASYQLPEAAIRTFCEQCQKSEYVQIKCVLTSTSSEKMVPLNLLASDRTMLIGMYIQSLEIRDCGAPAANDVGKIQKIDDYGQFHTLWKAGKNFTVLPGIDSFVIIHNNFG